MSSLLNGTLLLNYGLILKLIAYILPFFQSLNTWKTPATPPKMWNAFFAVSFTYCLALPGWDGAAGKAIEKCWNIYCKTAIFHIFGMFRLFFEGPKFRHSPISKYFPVNVQNNSVIFSPVLTNHFHKRFLLI